MPSTSSAFLMSVPARYRRWNSSRVMQSPDSRETNALVCAVMAAPLSSRRAGKYLGSGQRLVALLCRGHERGESFVRLLDGILVGLAMRDWIEDATFPLRQRDEIRLIVI